MSNFPDSYCSTTALFDDHSGLDDSCIEEEPQEEITVLNSEEHPSDERNCERKQALYVSTASLPRIKWTGFSQCQWRQTAVLLLGIFLTLAALTLVMVGTIGSRQHASIKVIHVKDPVNLKSLRDVGPGNFTFAQLMTLANIAAGKPVTQESITSRLVTGLASVPKLVDGRADTCVNTVRRTGLLWKLDLLGSFKISSIRILIGTRYTGQSPISVAQSHGTNDTSLYKCTADTGAATKISTYTDQHWICSSTSKSRYIILKTELGESPSSKTPQRLKICEVLAFA